jgi:hypothetical protein
LTHGAGARHRTTTMAADAGSKVAQALAVDQNADVIGEERGCCTSPDQMPPSWRFDLRMALGGAGPRHRDQARDPASAGPNRGSRRGDWGRRRTTGNGIVIPDVGAISGAIPPICPIGDTSKSAYLQAFLDAGGGTRTPDTRIMIPLL